MEDHLKLKKSGGTLKGVWRPHKTRDSMIGFIEYWVEPTEIPASRYRGWIGLSASKYGNWQKRSGQANEHNGQIPPDFWWEEWEPKAIRPRIQVRSATLLHSSSHAHLFEYDGWLLKA